MWVAVIALRSFNHLAGIVLITSANINKTSKKMYVNSYHMCIHVSHPCIEICARTIMHFCGQHNSYVCVHVCELVV